MMTSSVKCSSPVNTIKNGSSTSICKVMCWNVWSMLNEVKRTDILQIFEDNDIEIGCVTETWFDGENGKFTTAIKEAGYLITHGFREEQKGGGVAIIYRNDLNCKPGEGSTTKFSSFEYSFITLVSGNKLKIMLVCIYRKQEVACTTFCDEFEKFMDTIFDLSDSMILTGDFNVWADDKDHADTKRLINLMHAYGLYQTINESTHRNGHILDHLYINPYQLKVTYKVEDSTLGITTDHLPIVFEIPLIERQVEKEQTVSFRKTKNIDIVELKNDLQPLRDHFSLVESDDFEMNYKYFDSIARQIVNKHAPMITRTRKSNNNPPWMDAEFKRCREKRRKLEKKWKRSKSDEDRRNYEEQRLNCAQLSIEKQRKYYSNVIEENGNNQRSLFKVVNHVLDKNKIKTLPKYDNPTKLADEFNEYYVKKISDLRRTIPESGDVSIVSDVFEGTKLSVFKPTNDEEIASIIKEFGIKTSCDDPIPSSILKLISMDVIPILTKLVNMSLSMGSMDGVKLSTIDPLLKKLGLDSEIKKNYRPVNSLLFISKLTERIVLKRLNEHMTLNCLHCESQYAYKKEHNTETMMLKIVDDVLLGFDENKGTILLFLDLSAAFDTIDINRLLSILSEEIGITGIALQWFRSFLTGRTQKVRVDGHFSKVLEVLFGVPQGSVLGPKLFSIYVRAQPKVFNLCSFKATSFADDSNGRKSFSFCYQYQVLKNDLSNCMNNITSWMSKQFLKINPEKTEMLLCYPDSLSDKVIIRGVIVGEQCIRFSDKVKNVGLWIDSNLTFDYHINKIVSHCHKLLKDISRVRSLLSTQHTEMLVHSVISCRLDYCNSMYFNIKKSNVKKLQKVQNAAARIVAQKRYRESISGTLKDLHWLRIESRVIFKLLLLTYKYIKGKCPPHFNFQYKSYNTHPNDYLMLKTISCKTKYGKRAFTYLAPRLWNALPVKIKTEENIQLFKSMVKTMLFSDTESFLRRAFLYN